MKLAGFDLETERAVPSDRSQSYALGITCAAIWANDLNQLFTGKVHYDGRYTNRMTVDDARYLATYLLTLAQDGYKIVTINGLSFDFRVLAEECQDPSLGVKLKELAWSHYDPCFQMMCQKGYPVGLEAMAEGFGLEGKSEGMGGLQAVNAWHGSREDQEKVLEYVAQDAKTTLEIASAVLRGGCIRWVTRKGNLASHRTRLLEARDAASLPLPRMDWWTGSDPPARKDFCAWAL